MKSTELRERFLAFFEAKDHVILPSHSLIPDNDKTLLWINAGVAPLKKYFSKQATPPSNRLASSQRSIRANDIENVGKTDRHHTMFEMLGNFAIDDYFKKESIEWAWEFLIQEIGIKESQLYVTVHPDDVEAKELWMEITHISEDKIFEDPDNFWEIGPGPCGPNTEIYFDRGAEYGCKLEDCRPGCDCDRFVEIWNLVFTQYNKEIDGSLTKLPYRNIDTGMGLERLASVVQKTPSNFETDLFMPIIKEIEKLSDSNYKDHTLAMRVISDHIRAVTFAIADGALPSNEGRGYVIRRVLRRAIRFGQKLGFEDPFMYKLVEVVIRIMQEHYTYLNDKTELIKKVVKNEEERFLITLAEGEKLLYSYLDDLEAENKNILSGKDAFKLYDTYGFPFELTLEIALENNIKVNQEEFEEEMIEQRERARAASKVGKGNVVAKEVFKNIDDGDIFVGYGKNQVETTVVAINNLDNDHVEFLLKETPFYAEAGGQVADLGSVYNDYGKLKVDDVVKLANNKILHKASVEEGIINLGDKVIASISKDRRREIKKHHTATHILHKALKEILGSHVNQAGSLVSSERLRFDFTHFSALTENEISQLENTVNKIILDNLDIETNLMSLDEATKTGAVALFDEKYDHEVRVISIGNYSKELCGGTHVTKTSEIGQFLILSESSIGSGTRRIEAIVGKKAHDYLKNKLNKLTLVEETLKAGQLDVLDKAKQIINKINVLEKENNKLQQKIFSFSAQKLMDNSVTIDGIDLIYEVVDVNSMEALREYMDQIKSKNPDSIIVIGCSDGEKVFLLTYVGDKLINERDLNAGKIIKKVARICDGGGGGRPQQAQAGGNSPEKLAEAIQAVPAIIEKFINK